MAPQSSQTNTATTTLVDWRIIAIMAFAAIAVLLIMYAQTAWSMVEIWYRSETFAHGFLILPISAYLLWKKRHEVVRLAPSTSYPAVGLLFLAGLGWFLAELVDIQVLRQMLLIAMLIIAVWALLGREIVRVVVFPLAFLFFAVPVGEALIPPLMDFTAWFSVKMLQFTGIPVYQEGTFFETPTGSWSVVEGCSGLRYLISSITLGTLYAYITYRSLTRRVLFIIASIIVPIIANGLRAYMIVMIAHLSDMKLALGVDHYIYGWVFFGIVMLLLFSIGSRWREDEPAPETQPGVLPTGMVRVSVPARPLAAAVAVTLIVAAIWPVTAGVIKSRLVGDYQIALAKPQPVTPWGVSDQPLTDWRPRYIGADAERHDSFTDGTRQVQLSLEYYYAQRQDAELINTQNVMVVQKHPVWREVGTRMMTLELPQGAVEAQVSVLRSGQQNLLVCYWYWIGGTHTSSPYLAKLLDMKGRLVGDHRAAAIIMATDFDEAQPEAEQRLQAFASAMMPTIEQSLAQVADGTAGQ